MRSKIMVLAAFFVFYSIPAFGVLSTSQIDMVRGKELLDTGDLQIIDEFVADGINELVTMSDFTLASKNRSTILSRANSQKQSAAEQYTEQFLESARKYLPKGFEQAEALGSEEQRVMVVMNLLILADSLEDVRLLSSVISWLQDRSNVIRYWAVHCVANPVIIKKLNNMNPADNSKLAGEILAKLNGVIDDSGPDVAALIAEFAAKINIPEAEKLLIKVADTRIRQYADWTVKDELLDATILRFLCEKLLTVNDPAVGRRFGQLYSYAMQRYIKDLKEGNLLTSEQKRQLASVLVETEQSCLGELLKMPQMAIKNAVELSDYTALQVEHDRLLGDLTKRGVLAERLNFDYGTEAGGTVRTVPLVLPEPPKE